MAIENHNSNGNSSQTFQNLFNRMLGNWPIPDSGTRAEKARLYREMFEQYGQARFRAGVEKAIKLHCSPFFPTVGEFSGFIPEPLVRNDTWTHSEEEWRRIRAEQATPEFRAAWTKLMKTIGLKEVPWPDEIGKIMEPRK